MEHQDLVKAVLQAGATKAVILPQSQIVLSDSFRKERFIKDICYLFY